MYLKRFYIIILSAFILVCCQSREEGQEAVLPELTTVKPSADSPVLAEPVKEIEQVRSSNSINTGEHSPEEILSFARTLIGVPYLFASIDPAKGFDCSGFITYVFKHFGISIPRSSVEFTNQGEEVDVDDAAPGDLILFTGTDSTTGIVGHMGLIESRRNDSLFFIHSSSGKANGVVITPFERYYKSRFVKVIRVFPGKYFE